MEKKVLEGNLVISYCYKTRKQKVLLCLLSSLSPHWRTYLSCNTVIILALDAIRYSITIFLHNYPFTFVFNSKYKKGKKSKNNNTKVGPFGEQGSKETANIHTKEKRKNKDSAG